MKTQTYKVEQTTNYSLFKSMKGNRALNLLNLKRIKASMEIKPLFSPITVNENFEVIDGQHRLEALKELKLPVWYIVVPEYGVEEVHVLNTHSANWKRTDYLQGYIDLGYRPYIQLQEFMQKYPQFGIQTAIHLIGLSKVGRNQDSKFKNIATAKYFERGELIVPDLNYAKGIADKIMDYAPFYSAFTRRSFIVALVKVITHRNYKHEEMLSRLSRRPEQLTDQTNVTNYVHLLEDIFNYHRREKVTLRY